MTDGIRVLGTEFPKSNTNCATCV